MFGNLASCVGPHRSCGTVSPTRTQPGTCSIRSAIRSAAITLAINRMLSREVTAAFRERTLDRRQQAFKAVLEAMEVDRLHTGQLSSGAIFGLQGCGWDGG